jgi:hypothetical protein
MFGKLLFGIATLLLLLSLGLSKVNAQPDVVSIVVPNANEFVEGNTENGIPFNFIIRSIRYQQIYESTQLSECGNIVQVNFRFDDNRPGDSETYPNIFIQLSTTNVTLAALSTTFADNIGPNVTTVYDGELIFSAPDCGSGPCPFDNTITLQTPFNYNPSDGNLLLDISNLQGSSYQQFDAVNPVPSITRRVFSLNVDAEIGEVDSLGLVTQFVCEPLPPPPPAPIPTLSEWGLIVMAGILGIVGFMVIRRRKVRV